MPRPALLHPVCGQPPLNFTTIHTGAEQNTLGRGCLVYVNVGADTDVTVVALADGVLRATAPKPLSCCLARSGNAEQAYLLPPCDELRRASSLHRHDLQKHPVIHQRVLPVRLARRNATSERLRAVSP